jgi:cytidylate kinase
MNSPAFGTIRQIELALSENELCLNQSINSFVKESLASIIPNSAKIITLDGLDGAGKSSLANAVGTMLAVPIINLDDYLIRDQGFYFEALKIDEIKLLISQNKKIIIEGCLLDRVISTIGVSSNFRIYVVRTVRMRSQPEYEFVEDRDILFETEDADQLIASKEEATRRLQQLTPELGWSEELYTLPELQKELIHYHRVSRPHLSADIIVKLSRMN